MRSNLTARSRYVWYYADLEATRLVKHVIQFISSSVLESANDIYRELMVAAT